MSSEKNLFHFSEGRKDRGSKQTERNEVFHTPQAHPPNPSGLILLGWGALKRDEVIPERR